MKLNISICSLINKKISTKISFYIIKNTHYIQMYKDLKTIYKFIRQIFILIAFPKNIFLMALRI